MENDKKRKFMVCEKCGKRLIERLPGGFFRFIFGKKPGDGKSPPVELIICGSVKMRCLRKSCRREYPEHWNLFHLMPSPKIEEKKDKDQD